VLQGPGCLNFTLILDFAGRPEIRSVRASYEYLLTRICEGCRARGIEAHREGISDLAIAGVKVSGNAQRRRRRAMLHHGTLLYQPDYEGMARYLREPDDRPEYRGARDHRAFVGAFTLGPAELRALIIEAFNIGRPSSAPTADELAAVQTLVQEKYSNPAWTYRR
jgi:lipoate-protein ligase A